MARLANLFWLLLSVTTVIAAPANATESATGLFDLVKRQQIVAQMVAGDRTENSDLWQAFAPAGDVQDAQSSANLVMQVYRQVEADWRGTLTRPENFLVAGLWVPGAGLYISSQPRVYTVYGSTTETGSQYLVRELATGAGQIWRTKFPEDNDVGTNSFYYHAEDGAEIFYERENMAALNGATEYPENSRMFVYGHFGRRAGRVQSPCGSNPTRNPSCALVLCRLNIIDNSRPTNLLNRGPNGNNCMGVFQPVPTATTTTTSTTTQARLITPTSIPDYLADALGDPIIIN